MLDWVTHLDVLLRDFSTLLGMLINEMLQILRDVLKDKMKLLWLTDDILQSNHVRMVELLEKWNLSDRCWGDPFLFMFKSNLFHSHNLRERLGESWSMKIDKESLLTSPVSVSLHL
jgi:hypothetical protein